ncbi:MAG: hypothetical protein M3Z85_20175 [Acidobacteriota bacterium]|nr:hypothetical protein [Acidobacteriota bacterium]
MTVQSQIERRIALGQGFFYVVSGLWPVFDRESFERVTGPKTDFWLVKTVGLLLTTAGGALIAAGLRRSVPPELKMVGAGSAASLSGIGFYYGTKGRISRIYLVDAMVQGGIAGLWIMASRR